MPEHTAPYPREAGAAALPPDRGEVIAILATMGDRAPSDVTEQIGSLELAWLISQVEERYETTIELDDDSLGQMMTVSGAVAALRQLLGSAEDA
jgi:hypothetical protein